MKVRATQDGTYGGYYRVGPSEDGQFPGEVFEIDDKPFEIRDPATGKALLELDENGKPIALMDEKGKQRYDGKGKPMFRIRMGSWFSAKWMERVGDNIEVTFDYPAFEIPVLYRQKKKPVGESTGMPTTMPIHSPAPVESVI